MHLPTCSSGLVHSLDRPSSGCCRWSNAGGRNPDDVISVSGRGTSAWGPKFFAGSQPSSTAIDAQRTLATERLTVTIAEDEEVDACVLVVDDRRSPFTAASSHRDPGRLRRGGGVPRAPRSTTTRSLPCSSNCSSAPEFARQPARPPPPPATVEEAARGRRGGSPLRSRIRYAEGADLRCRRFTAELVRYISSSNARKTRTGDPALQRTGRDEPGPALGDHHEPGQRAPSCEVRVDDDPRGGTHLLHVDG